MSSTAVESRHEAQKHDQRGLLIAGLPFDIKSHGKGSKYLEYLYDGRPMMLYDHLPVFKPIVQLMEMYRELERTVAGLVKGKDDETARAEKAEEEKRVEFKRKASPAK